tara:strand:- start:2545 stop:3627 length:1083 start_codon:yes stop_codon:yes gene_type:complete
MTVYKNYKIMKKVLSVVLMGILSLSGSLWAVEDEPSIPFERNEDHGSVSTLEDDGSNPPEWSIEDIYVQFLKRLDGHGDDYYLDVDLDEYLQSKGSVQGMPRLASMLIYVNQVDYPVNAMSDTVLHLAIRKSQYHIVSQLLLNQRAPANPNAVNVDGDTPLHTAIQDCKSDLEAGPYAKYLEELGNPCVEIIELLLICGADPTIRNNNNETPACMAARLGNIEALAIMVPYINDDSTKIAIAELLYNARMKDNSIRTTIMRFLHKALDFLVGRKYCTPTIVEINNDMDGEDAGLNHNEDPENAEDGAKEEEKKEEEEEVWELTETEAPMNNDVLRGTEISAGEQLFAEFMRDYHIGGSAP